MRHTLFALTFALLAACGKSGKINEADLLKDPALNFKVGVETLQNPDKKTGAVDYNLAYERFRKSEELSGGAKASFNAGWVAEQLSRPTDAEAHYRKAHELDPTYEPALFSLARVLTTAGKHDEAVELYKGVAAKDPTNWEKQNDVVTALIGAGRYDDAFAAAQEILRHKPDEAGVYRNLSSLYYAKQNYSLSQLTAEKALELNAGDPGVYNNMGVTFLIQGDEAAAIEKFKTALKIAPSNFEANMNLGFVALNSGDYNLAKTSFDAATAANPTSVDAKLGLAVAQRGMKDFKASQDLYDEVIKADPQNKAAYFNAATLNRKYTLDFNQAQKYLDAYIAAKSGAVTPDDDVFKEKELVAQAIAAKEEKDRIERERKAAEEAKAERDRLLLEEMATIITQTKQKLTANAQCIDPASVEEVSMVLEQAQMVVDEKDITMAGDIRMMMDAYVPAVDEAIAGCAGAAPAEPAPAEPAPAEAPPADAQPAPQ